MGHKTVQIMGFIMMTIFMAAAAGSYNKLLDPNTLSNEHLSHEQPTRRNGWIVMYALCFFFANFGKFYLNSENYCDIFIFFRS